MRNYTKNINLKINRIYFFEQFVLNDSFHFFKYQIQVMIIFAVVVLIFSFLIWNKVFVGGFVVS